MDNSFRGLTAARAAIKTGFAVYLAKLEEQNLFSTNGQILELITSPRLSVSGSACVCMCEYKYHNYL